MRQERFHTLEQGIVLIREESSRGPISVRELLSILPGKGKSLFLVLLSLPFCLPLQIPGFSTPFGLFVIFIGLRTLFGKEHIWLPRRILNKKIKPQTIEKLSKKTLRLVKKIKPWIHPRLDFFCHHPVMKIINGIIITFLGVLLSLPLPIPFSNLMAAWPLFFLGMGTLEDDGVLVLISYALSLLAIGFFVAIGFSLKLLAQAQ